MFVHKVTKYDPKDWGERGYNGPEDTDCDEGPVEQAYVDSVRDFALEAGVSALAIRSPGHFDGGRIRGVPRRADPLAGIVDGGQDAIFDGMEVDLDQACEIVRLMLRSQNFWCRLEREDRFFVHVGWDMYMYIGASSDCVAAVERARARGLFPVRLDRSPYAAEADGDPTELRIADAQFWVHLEDALGNHGALMIEEMAVSNSVHWHRVTSRAEIEQVRAAVRPRALLSVWPDLEPTLSPDVASALASTETQDFVWLDRDGVVSWSPFYGGDEPTDDADLQTLIPKAERAGCQPICIEERLPLLVGVLPDADGFVRASWPVSHGL